MSTKILSGNIFDSQCRALVNPVNCVGVAGRGLALEFKRRYPDAYDSYRLRCRSGFLRLGDVYSFLSKDRWIIYFPTKHHWRDDSSIEMIESGLYYLTREIAFRKIRSIAIPALGCGCGGLDWEDVEPLILDAMEGTGIEVEIYEPKS